MASCQAPPWPLAHSPPQQDGGGNEEKKSSWVELKTGRSLTSYCHWKNCLDLGKIKFPCFPRGATTLAEGLGKKRQEVCQRNSKGSFAA